MIKNKILFTVTMILFTYTTIVVTQPTSKVKAEKNKTVKVEKQEEINQAAQTLDLEDTNNNTLLTRHEADLVTYFCKPIEFTPEGIAHYFKYTYNHPEYINYLPYNLSHMIQFLKYGIETGQNEAYAASVIKMFLQKVKAAPYIEAESFVNFMGEFSKVIKPYLEKKESNFLAEMQVVLKNKLSEMFARYFNVFQKNPDTFMNSLAEQIAKQTNQSVTQQHIEVEQIKKDVLRFFEICANKLIWSSKDDIQTWYSCNRLAHECQICLDNSVLCDANALDDMCWSIIHRFCYFVDLSKDTLSKDFYAQVLHDLQTKPLLLTALEEQEQLMISKKEHLICKLKTCRDICCPIQISM